MREKEDAESAAPAAKKVAVVAEEDERGVVQVELEGVWGFETKMTDIDAMQAEDDEVKLIRAIRNGADYTKLEAVPAAFAAVNSDKSRDPECQNFAEGKTGDSTTWR